LPVPGGTTLVDAPLPPVTAASEYVRWVQSTLDRVLGLRLPIDGVMGPETRSAIRSFQRRHGLTADGPDTEEALREAARPAGGGAIAP
jgi:peptidoglycan hydrolase-like protein with peptidoglycan-binding domain